MAEFTMSSSDEALVLSAENEIRNYTGVRVWADALSLIARNGVLEIGGHVRTRAEREVTENVALKTKGVKDVISHLYVDTDLEIAVGKALGTDARTRGGFPGILVGSAFGDIYLKGSVPSADMKKAAAEISGKVDGVRSVINALETSGAVAAPAAAGAKPAVAAKPVVAGAKPVVAVKPPTPAAVKPAGGVKVPAPVSGKPVVARAGAGSGSAVKPPASVSGRPVVARGGAVVTPKPAETPPPAEEAPIVEEAAAEMQTAAVVDEPMAAQAVEEIVETSSVEETAAPTPAPAPVAKPAAAPRPNASGITPVAPPASVTGRPVVARRTNKPTEE